MNIFYKPQAVKQLAKIPKKKRLKILKKMENLSQYPLVGKVLKGELKGLCSLKVWPYRIIYEYSNKKIIIYSIAHRQSVYKEY